MRPAWGRWRQRIRGGRVGEFAAAAALEAVAASRVAAVVVAAVAAVVVVVVVAPAWPPMEAESELAAGEWETARGPGAAGRERRGAGGRRWRRT